MSPRRLFVFDQYRLDEQERRLLRGSEPVPLPPKVFDLLDELVRNAGHLLHKEHLLEKVWPDVVVEEGSLTRSISTLRRVLGMTADGRNYIQTVSKRGYRFVSDVRETTGDDLDQPASTRGIPLAPSLAATEPFQFVGRESELLQMEAVWQRARNGRPQLLLIAGEPGIGKTRLAVEFGRRQADATTVLVGCNDEENLVPYQPFVESLAWYVHHCPAADLREQLAAIGGGAELGPLIPELAARVSDLPATPPVSPEGQRYRLFEAVSALLAIASRTRPVLLLFDDLHWADKATLLLLRHIMRSARAASLAVVATYRDSELGRTHPLGEMLVPLRRDPAVTRLTLRGLDAGNVSALVDSIVGAGVHARLTQAVMDTTDGNPFFATEVLLHLKETGAIARVGEGPGSTIEPATVGLSEGIKDVIGRRLSRLSAACNRALGVAAIIGREFDAALLEAVCDLPESDLLDALEEAIRAQLITESPRISGRFEFVHALIRETLYGELSSPRRVRLHRRVAETIERSAGTGTRPLSELAFHFSQAASAGTADRAIDYATRAGDHAARGLAHEEAVRLFDMALQSLEFGPADARTAQVRVDLHTRRARSFDALGQWAAEVRELNAAIDHLDPDRIEQRCELELALARASFLLLDIRPVEQYATEALQLAERLQRSDLAANAVAWLARCRQANGDLAATIDMDRIAMARAPRTAAVAQMMGPLTLYLAGQSKDAIPLATEAADAARSSGDTTFVMYALSHVGLNMTAAGRYADASKAFDEVRSFGRKYGALPMLARATAMAAGMHLLLFDFDGAEALQLEARELGRSVGFTPAVISAGIDSLLMLARRHEPGRAEGLLVETAAAAASTADWHQWLWQLRLTQARAEIALERHAFDEAVATATDAVEQSRARRRPKYHALALIARARALDRLARTRDAIADARTAVRVARMTSDPALLLLALETGLALEATDELSTGARAVIDRIHEALPDETMRRCFVESEVVTRIRTRT